MEKISQAGHRIAFHRRDMHNSRIELDDSANARGRVSKGERVAKAVINGQLRRSAHQAVTLVTQ